jgi:outer membrane immunogenic protein
MLRVGDCFMGWGTQMRLILSFVLAYMVASTAVAADMTPFYPLARQESLSNNWSGLYVGVNAGWIDSSHNAITNTATDAGPTGFGYYLAIGAIPGDVATEHNGFIGGGQIGYNWQFEPKWVWGLEADVDWAVNGSSDTMAVFPGSKTSVPLSTVYSTAMDTLGTVRPRVGYLSSQQLLWYATGGMAFANTKIGSAFYCDACKPRPFAPATIVQNGSISAGWTAGGGVEWKVTSALSIKAEYLYVDLGSQSDIITYAYGKCGTPTNPAPCISTLTSFFNERDNVIRIGLNYRIF